MKPGRELLIVAAIAVLAMCIGCGVLGNPNPCDRTQSMRNAPGGSDRAELRSHYYSRFG